METNPTTSTAIEPDGLARKIAARLAADPAELTLWRSLGEDGYHVVDAEGRVLDTSDAMSSHPFEPDGVADAWLDGDVVVVMADGDHEVRAPITARAGRAS